MTVARATMDATPSFEWLKYFLSLVGPIALVAGWEHGGMVGRMSTVFLYEVVTPVCDVIIGTGSNGEVISGDRAKDDKAGDSWFRVPLLSWAAVHFMLLVWVLQKAMTLAWWEVVWLGFSTGLVTSVSIAVAHELLHKLERTDRTVASLLLSSLLFGHYRVAHLEHHRRVATPEDFSTARLNETVYEFLPRSLWGALSFALQTEVQKARADDKWLFNVENESMINWAFTGAFLVLSTVLFGASGGAVFLVQAACAATVHEMTSYVEHYGLCRKQDSNGNYERVNFEHSWLAPQRLTNYLTFNVQIHPDHHMHALRPYEQLHVTSSPLLPAGYPAMMALAYLPPLWRRIIHPRLPKPAE